MRENLGRKKAEDRIGTFYAENPYPNFEAVPKKIKSFLYPYLNEINKKLDGKVVTKISKEKNYCKAEEYHQKYIQKKGL